MATAKVTITATITREIEVSHAETEEDFKTSVLDDNTEWIDDLTTAATIVKIEDFEGDEPEEDEEGPDDEVPF